MRVATGPVQVPKGKHPPLYLVRSDRRGAKTDAGHGGTWLCGRRGRWGATCARAERGGAGPRGGAGGRSTQRLVRFGELRKG